MNVLVIGGAGNITNAILEKLNKEGDRIYVLTGSEVKLHTYRYVFEQYSFSYESPSIKEIFESIRPDVTIFMGAYDTNFQWKNEREEAVRYSAGLLNILMGYSLVKCGRFIYLSSECVYGQSSASAIAEEENVTARDFKGMVIAQGEDQCRSYQSFDGLDIMILRMDHLYAIPENRDEVTDICSRMCIQALQTGKIQANARHSFSGLYISDAVVYLYTLLSAQNHAQPLYHVSSGQEMTEMELAQLVQKEMGDAVSVVDNTVGEEYKIVLRGKKFQEEYETEVFHPIESVVPDMVKYIKRHKNIFLSADDAGMGFFGRLWQNSKSLIRALIPFIENMIVFIPAFMLNNRAVGSAYFSKLDFYLLYVILFAILYGQQQAAFSAILATAGYIFRQMYTRTGFEVLMDFNTYVWIAQLFILGLVIGYLHDQLAIIKKEKKEQVSYLSGQIDDIQDINTSNVRIKNVLEEQVINHNQSIGKIYEITSELEQYAPAEVMFYAAEVVARVLNTKDVAIYSIANQQYARLFSFTSAKARSLGNSICYTDMEEMCAQIMQKKVYINQAFDERYPLLANGIYDENQLRMIVMVWGLPWERMNLGMANMLTVIGYLIQNAVLRADRYQKALESEQYKRGTRILRSEAFVSVVNAYMKAEKKGLTACALLAVETMPHTDEEASDADSLEEQFDREGQQIVKLLRTSDYIGELEDGRLYILLSNTDRKGAQYVIDRLALIGCTAVYQEDFEVS